MSPAALDFEPLDYDARYYIQTAKDNITSFGQIVAEAVSNADESITRRARRDGVSDVGTISIYYNPDTMDLRVVDDGVGMTADEMRDRLGRVGASTQSDSKRGFFHRGIREVFTAMGGGVFDSAAMDETGKTVLSRAEFDARRGMAISRANVAATAARRKDVGIAATGSAITVPLKPIALGKPTQFEPGTMAWQIETCVQIRPVLLDPNRIVEFHYGSDAPRHIQYKYESGEVLVDKAVVNVAGLSGTFWVSAAKKPLKGLAGRQTRRNGILIRGERAAYEVSLGVKLKSNPAMQLIFGELRLDDIERVQREADAKADDDAQLVYKANRTGLNPEHEVAEAIYAFIDDRLTPLVANLDPGGRKEVSADVKRQLQKLARLINATVDGASKSKDVPDRQGDPHLNSRQSGSNDTDPPEPPEWRPPEVLDGLAFAYNKIFLNAQQARTVRLWIDTAKIPIGTPLERLSQVDEVVHVASMQPMSVPTPKHGFIAQVDVNFVAGGTEGRHEFEARAEGYVCTLPVHVRYPRTSGFISQIVFDNNDWESGSALYDPASGRVTVYVGRPEFRVAAAAARARKVKDPMQDALYRQLVVESVREAALRPAAERRAEVEWDDLAKEERAEKDAFHRLVLTEYYELDYLLRSKLLKAFVDV